MYFTWVGQLGKRPVSGITRLHFRTSLSWLMSRFTWIKASLPGIKVRLLLPRFWLEPAHALAETVFDGTERLGWDNILLPLEVDER